MYKTVDETLFDLCIRIYALSYALHRLSRFLFKARSRVAHQANERSSTYQPVAELNTSLLFFLGTSESTKNRGKKAKTQAQKSICVDFGYWKFQLWRVRVIPLGPESDYLGRAISLSLRAFNWRRACCVQQ